MLPYVNRTSFPLAFPFLFPFSSVFRLPSPPLPLHVLFHYSWVESRDLHPSQTHPDQSTHTSQSDTLTHKYTHSNTHSVSLLEEFVKMWINIFFFFFVILRKTLAGVVSQQQLLTNEDLNVFFSLRLFTSCTGNLRLTGREHVWRETELAQTRLRLQFRVFNWTFWHLFIKMTHILFLLLFILFLQTNLLGYMNTFSMQKSQKWSLGLCLTFFLHLSLLH